MTNQHVNPEEYELLLVNSARQLIPTRPISTVLRSSGAAVTVYFREPRATGGYPETKLLFPLSHDSGRTEQWWLEYEIWTHKGAGGFVDPALIIPLLFQEVIDTLEAAGGGLPASGPIGDD